MSASPENQEQPQQQSGSNSFTPPPPRPKHVNPEELLERKRQEEEEAARRQQQEGNDTTNNEDEPATAAQTRQTNEHPQSEQDLNATDNNVENRAAATVTTQPGNESNNNTTTTTSNNNNATGNDVYDAPAAADQELTEEEQKKRREEEDEEDRRMEQQITFKKERNELEAEEAKIRDATTEEESAAFQSEIVDAAKTAQQNYAQSLRDQLAVAEASAELRRKEAAKLVTALAEIRRHFATHQERVNLTKSYADVALKCRHFDQWMNDKYMGSPKVTRHDRTGLISLDEMEEMHSRRDDLLDELQRLADNMAGLRHLVMDASELEIDNGDDTGSNYESGSQIEGGAQQQKQITDSNNNNKPKAITDGKQQNQQLVEHNNTDEHNLTARTMTAASVYSRTSATSRADEALMNQKNLLVKTKQLEDQKRQLQSEISHREKQSEVKLLQFNRSIKAAAAAMSGLNKELFRLEEAVNAHFRVLKTSYQSMKTEFPQLFEFDAFTQDGPPAKKKQAAKSIKINEQQQEPKQIADKPNENTSSRRDSIHSNNSQNKVGRIANVAHTVSVAQQKSQNSNNNIRNTTAAEQRAATAASLAREASRLVSPTMSDRVNRAAGDMRKEKAERQKSIVDRAREESNEEARSHRRMEREQLQTSNVSPKEELRQKQHAEQMKTLGRKSFQRV